MRIENNIQHQSFRGTFYRNQHLEAVLTKANNLDKIVFSSVLRNMERNNDKKVFELGIKESLLGLLCYGLSEQPHFIKLSDKIFEKETYRDFYTDILGQLNTILKRFYPQVKNEQEAELEILNSKEKLPFYTEDRFETENGLEDEKKVIPNIHEDLLAFEDCFRDSELFNYRQDMLKTYVTQYDTDDVELSRNLMPIANTIEYYNQINGSFEFGAKRITDNKIKLNEEIEKKELPKEFTHFALDYVRDLSIGEARALYNFLKKINMDDYDDFIQKNKSMLKKNNYTYVLNCMSDAVITSSIKDKNYYSPKLFNFLFEHPNDRFLVTSTDNLGNEHFDEYGAKFFDSLCKRCGDRKKATDIFNSCRIYMEYGVYKINVDKARKVLADFGYIFSDEEKNEVITILKPYLNDDRITTLCEEIEKNKILNAPEMARYITKRSDKTGIEKAIECGLKSLIKYKNPIGETLSEFDEKLMNFLIKYPECRDFVVSKNSDGNEIVNSMGIRLYTQLQRKIKNPEIATDIYKSCQSIVNSGEKQGAVTLNSKGSVFCRLLESNHTYDETIAIYNLIKEYRLTNPSELTESCAKYKNRLSFDKLCDIIKNSFVKKVCDKQESYSFDSHLMDFLVKYPNDRDNVVMKNEYGGEYYDARKARTIEHLRRQAQREDYQEYYSPRQLNYQNNDNKPDKSGTHETENVFNTDNKVLEKNPNINLFGGNTIINVGGTIHRKVIVDGRVVEDITITDDGIFY